MDVPEFPTLTTARFRAFFAALRKRGIDVEEQLTRRGVEVEALLDPLHRMPREQILKLFGQLGFGHDMGELGLEAAQELLPQDLDLLGHLLASAPTLGAALDQGVRYLGIMHDGVELELKREGEHARLLHRIAGGRPQWPMMVDFAMASLVRLFRDITEQAWPLLLVKLARPRPKHPANYSRWFAAPVEFEAECNELVFPAAALAHELPRANPSLNAVLERQAIASLRALPDASAKQPFLERVRLHLSAGLDRDELNVGELAQRLRMGERTLRRRLEASGTTFRALLDELRRERALVLIQNPKLNLSQIAHQLGFSGATSFGRAFQRWTGSMPKQYTRRMRSP